MIFADQSLLYLDEIRSLSELPMDKLIRIKSSFGSGNGITNENENENEEIASSRTIPVTLPMALPLKRSNNNKKPIRRYEDHYDEKGKDTKISKIFQLAVTALSFLAFGGYLLTLIISAIRRNNGNNGTNGNNVLIFSVIIIFKIFCLHWIKNSFINYPFNIHFLNNLIRSYSYLLIFQIAF
ncbi:hypothetical protein X777_10854 [Ooceraea biroi]|uniref:Uncharacterized protein n=1 Tax=Ooceraea biroi TaxID=2015173 RepID=A0A026W474_OOCBI|nr:hypothetical protein X777_10854 [Ooceraea biroi]